MKNLGGFTLIEVLAAVALISVIALTAVSLFYCTSETYIKREKSMDIRQNVRGAMETITQDIKRTNDSSNIKIESNRLYVGYNNYFFVPRKNCISMNSNEGQELANLIAGFLFSMDGRRVSVTITGVDGYSLSNIIYLSK